MPYIGNQPYQGVIDSGNIVDGSIQTGDLANSAVTTAKIADSNITSAKIADTGVTVAKLNSDVTQLIAQGGGPKITGVAITNSSWTVLDDTAVDTAGGYIKLTGTNFVTGCSVVVGTTSATAVTFTSSTELRVQLPAQAAGTYILYVTNPDGGTAIRVNAVTYSATPSWVTSSTLPQQDDGVAISIQLSATSATTYALQAGSTLPSGLTLTSGGLLSGTVSGLANDTSYSFTVVATDAELQDSPRAFTVNIAASDTYFNLTTLLINGDTAPNVLTDASNNNFNLIAYGSTRASNFTPYGTAWSNYFDGSGDYLYAGSNIAFQMGTGDFTYECYVYHTNLSGQQTYFARTTGNNNGMYFYKDTSNYVGVYYTGQIATSNITITTNQWYHLVATRLSGILKIFINGTEVASVANTTNLTEQVCYIGADSNGTNPFFGYISNARILKGTGYSSITVPTQPLTAIANTSLLTCHANRLVDGSANNFAITRTGDVAVRSFNPFNITNTGISGSMYFDGDGDYIIGSSGGFLGGGDFTVEMWYYPTTSSFGRGGAQNWACILFDTRETSSSDASGFLLGITNTGQGQLYLGGGTPGAVAATTNTMRHLEWNHIAAVRIGSTITVYINGIAGSTYTYSTNFLRNRVQISGPYDVLSSTYIMAEGYIADVRSISGTGVYTGNFSIPKLGLLQKSGSASAAVYSNTTNINTTFSDTNCQLLSLQYKQPHNNHAFQDSSTNNHLITRNGNTTQGTFSPFSPAGWSLSFTSGNGITVPTSIATSLASSGATFTIEAWVYLNSYGSAPTNQEYYNRAIFGIGNTYGAFLIDSTGKLNLYSYDGTGRFTTSTGTVALRTWTHVAASVTGGVIKLFIDGTLSGSGTWYGHIGGAITTCIGSTSDTNAGTNRHFDGYIASFRLSNIARYNISFNKPTSLYTTDANTVILTGQLNRLVDESNSPQTLTNVSASIQAYSPFKPTAAYSPTTHGGSGYFDGTGDYLAVPDSTALDLSADFTIEAWVNLANISAEYCVFHNHTSDFNGVALTINQGRPRALAGNGTWFIASDSSITLATNTWNHIAYTRSGNTWTIWVNGVSGLVVTNSATPSYTGGAQIGRLTSGVPLAFPGYMSNLRVVKGTSVYTSAFTPPTAPLTAITNTSLLLNFTDAAARDSTGRLVLETVNDSKVSTVQKKYGTGAMYFDGNMDYIKTTGPYLTGIGTGNFTIEGWYNFLDFTVRNVYFQRFWSFGTGLANHVTLNIDTSGYPVYRNNDAVLITSTIALSINTWAHVALVRNNGTTYLYINGVAGGSTNTNSDFSSRATNNLLIGNESDGNGGSLYGYVDDFRITRYARYTGTSTSTPNFTPPAQTFKLR